mgnify:FL=1
MKYDEILGLIYEHLNDNEIEYLLSALHQDLGREGMFYCEVCNENSAYNFHMKHGEVPVSQIVWDAVEEGKKLNKKARHSIAK